MTWARLLFEPKLEFRSAGCNVIRKMRKKVWRLGFKPLGLNHNLETGIWSLRMGFGIRI